MDWIGFLNQAPIAAAILAVVLVFLKEMKARDLVFTNAITKVTDSFNVALKAHGDADIEAQREISTKYADGAARTMIALDANTAALGEIKGVILTRKLESLQAQTLDTLKVNS